MENKNGNNIIILLLCISVFAFINVLFRYTKLATSVVKTGDALYVYEKLEPTSHI